MEVKSWKTSTAAAIIAAGTAITGALAAFGILTTEQATAIVASVTAIAGAIGLFVAKDHDVTGSPAQKTEDVTTVVKEK